MTDTDALIKTLFTYVRPSKKCYVIRTLHKRLFLRLVKLQEKEQMYKSIQEVTDTFKIHKEITELLKEKAEVLHLIYWFKTCIAGREKIDKEKKHVKKNRYR